LAAARVAALFQIANFRLSGGCAGPADLCQVRGGPGWARQAPHQRSPATGL